MKEVTGRVFSIARDNAPVPGCTISKEVYGVKATNRFKIALLLALE